MLTKPKKILVLCLLLTGSKLPAETTLGHSEWHSTTHLGFGVEDQSSTGFHGTQGSTLFLDLDRKATENIAVGIRTSAFGGKNSGAEFYRMATGPLISFRIYNKFNISLALGFFRESGLDDKGDSAYTSKGQMFQIGWERVFPLSKAIELCWGGYWSRHWGNLDLDASQGTQSGSVAQYSSSSANIGNSRGIELGFKVRL